MADNDKLAFYVKCRPQNADLEPIVLKHHRVFIGYPAWKQGYKYDRHCARKWLLDISVSDAVWNHNGLSNELKSSYRKQITLNRWYATHVRPDHIVAVPRPAEGLCFLGKIKRRFSLVDDPEWGDEYLELRRTSGLDLEPEAEHIGDVVQCWEVEQWKPIPFPLVPRWISFHLLSRNTIGLLYPRPDGEEAQDTLLALYGGTYKPALGETADLAEIEARLMTWTSPSIFEHLVCDLLQLEQPKVRWWHVGGSGDGGVDGLAINESGTITAALQCKWMMNTTAQSIADQLLEKLNRHWCVQPSVYIAALFHEGDEDVPKNATFLRRQRIAELLLKHSSCCAFARTLGVRK